MYSSLFYAALCSDPSATKVEGATGAELSNSLYTSFSDADESIGVRHSAN